MSRVSDKIIGDLCCRLDAANLLAEQQARDLEKLRAEVVSEKLLHCLRKECHDEVVARIREIDARDNAVGNLSDRIMGVLSSRTAMAVKLAKIAKLIQPFHESWNVPGARHYWEGVS